MSLTRIYRGYEICGDLTIEVTKPNGEKIPFEVYYEKSIREAFHKWVDDQFILKCSSCESAIIKGDWFLDNNDRQFCTIACACKFNHSFRLPSRIFAPVLTKCRDV